MQLSLRVVCPFCMFTIVLPCLTFSLVVAGRLLFLPLIKQFLSKNLVLKSYLQFESQEFFSWRKTADQEHFFLLHIRQ